MSQVLSQEEVDTLLKGVSDGEVETEQKEEVDPSEIRPYDLTAQDRIIGQKMPTLDLAADKFTRLFRTTLSALLKRVVAVNARSMKVLKYSDFVKSIQLPASLHIFQMKPLGGSALLTVEPQVAFTLVDLIFGGSGRESFKVDGRDFTVIENNVIKRIALNTLTDFEKVWETILKIEVVYQRQETNPQFAQLVMPADTVIVLPFEVDLGVASGEIRFCIPYSTIEPIRDKLQVSYRTDTADVDKKWASRFVERLYTSMVTLSVELGKAELTGRDVISLKKGDVIPLDTHVNDTLHVFVEDVLKFKGRPGSYKGNQAVEVIGCTDEKGGLLHGTG